MMPLEHNKATKTLPTWYFMEARLKYGSELSEMKNVLKIVNGGAKTKDFGKTILSISMTIYVGRGAEVGKAVENWK